MKKLSFLLVLVSLMIASTNLQAQENEENATLDQGPISGQFDYTIEESSRYEEYRVVRTTWLYKLKANVLDSLQTLKTETKNLESDIDSLQNHISKINGTLNSTQKKLDQAITSKNSLMFFGNEILKTKYDTIMWGMVIVLAIALVFVFFLFRRSHMVTAQMREKYSELEKEYDAHKKRALEKEKTMARQHLNEINKLRGRN